MTSRHELEALLTTVGAPDALLQAYPQLRTRANALHMIFTADKLLSELRDIDDNPCRVYSVCPGDSTCTYFGLPGRIDLALVHGGRIKVVDTGSAPENMPTRVLRKVLRTIDNFLWLVTGGRK